MRVVSDYLTRTVLARFVMHVFLVLIYLVPAVIMLPGRNIEHIMHSLLVFFIILVTCLLP